MRAAVRHSTFFAALFVFAAAFIPFDSIRSSVSADAASQKLDRVLQHRATLAGHSRVIVRASGVLAPAVEAIVQQAGGTVGRRLAGIRGHVAIVPNSALRRLAASPLVESLSLDRD